MFVRTLKTTFTAGLLATTMALTTMTPTSASARMSDDEIAALLGFLALGVVIQNSRNNNRTSTPDPVQVRPNRTDGHDRNDRNERNERGNRNWQVLPAQCATTVESRRGQTVRMFGQRCLNNNYRFTNRLPQQCYITFRGERGAQRQGYDARCMRNAGFRTDRR